MVRDPEIRVLTRDAATASRVSLWSPHPRGGAAPRNSHGDEEVEENSAQDAGRGGRRRARAHAAVGDDGDEGLSDPLEAVPPRGRAALVDEDGAAAVHPPPVGAAGEGGLHDADRQPDPARRREVGQAGGHDHARGGRRAAGGGADDAGDGGAADVALHGAGRRARREGAPAPREGEGGELEAELRDGVRVLRDRLRCARARPPPRRRARPPAPPSRRAARAAASPLPARLQRCRCVRGCS